MKYVKVVLPFLIFFLLLTFISLTSFTVYQCGKEGFIPKGTFCYFILTGKR